MTKVMVVDDERNIREGIIHLIDWNSLDCEITGDVANGQEALSLLEHQTFDLIVSDIKMPILDGLELANQVRNKYPKTKVIILTAYSDFSYAKKAIQYDVVDFVVKNEFMSALPVAVEKAKELIRREQESSKDDRLDHAAYQKHLIRRLLKGKGIDPQERTEYGLDAAYDVLLFCELDEETAEEAKLDSKKMDMFIERSFRGHKVERMDWEENAFLILIQESEALKAETAAFADSIKGFMNVEVRIGIAFNECNNLRIVLEDARAALAGICSSEEFVRYSQPSRVKRQEQKEPVSIKRWQEKFVSANPVSREKMDGFILDFTRELKATESSLKQMRMDFLVLGEAIIQGTRNGDSPVWADVRKTYYQRIHSSWSLFRLSVQLRRLIERVDKMRAEEKSEKSSLVSGVNGYIERHYHSGVSLQDLSQALFLNGSYISRAYKKATGITITDAVHAYRLNQAKALLLQTDMKIYEISLKVGVEDPAYFTRLFIKRIGMSPSDYRNSHR